MGWVRMNRYDFIEKLRTALSGKVNQSILNENLKYYEEYIDTELRKGGREEAVIAALGDPRLLAKSIAEANKHAGLNYGYEEDNSTIDYEEAQQDRPNTGRVDINGRTFRIQGWLIAALVILVIVLVISIVFSLISFVLPIVLPIILIVLLVRFVASFINRR